jgi:hypothetical protein
MTGWTGRAPDGRCLVRRRFCGSERFAPSLGDFADHWAYDLEHELRHHHFSLYPDDERPPDPMRRYLCQTASLEIK